ncbi:microtubule-associated tumor suppressor candidate 2 isoform X2 [Brachyhypopomus gauderio]|uniref:microtubule-associated tumor suppressor candidate 2 isoform X2 n=1 Tax=Brachyhypopomus gauderio TaxID=698409 RepID=UPI0040434806
MNDTFVGPVGTSFQDDREETSNNNRCGPDSEAEDANANERWRREGKTLEVFISHTKEEVTKIPMWGTNSQCDDPELAEFEMLECQELEESEENYVVPGTLSNIVSQIKGEVQKGICMNVDSRPSVNEQDAVYSEPVSRTAETIAEPSSDNDVFVSCYSTMSSLGGSLVSALDNAGRAHTTDSWPAQSEPYRTVSDLTLPSQSCLTVSDRSRNSLHADGTHVDLSLNTVTLSEEPLSEAQENQPDQSTVMCKETSGQRNRINECNPSIVGAEPKHIDIRKTSEDNVGHHGSSSVECQAIIREECKHPDAKTISALKKSYQPFGSEVTEPLLINSRFPHDPSHKLKRRPSHCDETPDKSLKPGSTGLTTQCVLAGPKLSQKQASLERPRSASPTSMDRRKPWGSPSPGAAPSSHKPSGSPRKQLPSSPAKTVSARAPQDPNISPQRSTRALKPPSKSYLSSGIPKPIPPQHPPKTEPESKRSPPAQKPRNVRPKIITSVGRSPQAKLLEGPYETSTLPSRLTGHPSTPVPRKQRAAGPHSSSSVLYDTYHQELQRAGRYSPTGLADSGIRRPAHTIPQKLLGKSESFHGEFPDRHVKEAGRPVLLSTPEASAVCRSPRALAPQLGLGTRQPGAKGRMLMSGQRSSSPLSHMSPPRQGYSCFLDPTAVEQKKSVSEVSARSLLPKAGRSGPHTPASSHTSPARLPAFGFIRSASVSSVSSNQSSNGTHSLPLRSASPVRKEHQRDEVPLPTASPSRRCAVVSTKPQAPVRQKSCVACVCGQAEGVEQERVRVQRAHVQRLRERCELQDRQLAALQDELRRVTRCMDVLTVTTQHFCTQSENGVLKEREVSLELCRIRDELAVAVGRWECVQGEKEEQEGRFQEQLEELRGRQQEDLQNLQERLRVQQQEEIQLLQEETQQQIELLYSQHHRQVEEMTQSHESAVQEMETVHSATLLTLQEEHTRTIKNLKMAHEQEKKSLEEEFEKLRLSLQDQVDTLTFQNHSLRDRAKRFEEALRRSTDEQIVDALAPYQHIEEDLKSLKEVLEMKNQQIHDQQLKISELERLAQRNVLLEERVQVLQQQNEDLKARVDMNLAMSRQLTEANANLQEYVEKESNEKKRLSRTNEELLWRLQTGELSPHMSPNQSPLHRPLEDPASPTRLQPCPP